MRFLYSYFSLHRSSTFSFKSISCTSIQVQSLIVVPSQRTPTIDDVRPLILMNGCGLRPARAGGIRLETEWVDAPKGTNVGVEGKTPVVFNYG